MHISDLQYQVISAQISAYKRRNDALAELPRSAERKRGFTAIASVLLRPER